MFEAFPKIARLNRDVIVTEKIDGTNAQIYIETLDDIDPPLGSMVKDDGTMWLAAGTRNRWLDIHNDNFGFANWAWANKEELFKLGPGRHFGEWWGQGIQRGYGLAEKRFSLFNTYRWSDDSVRPACCHVVPKLTSGQEMHDCVEVALNALRTAGSVAAPGFMDPEGIVVFHTASNGMFKVTLENDEEPKSKVKAA